MELLKPEERKSLVEEICSRFHKDGISRLETVGHFEKYTPLYHFRIAEPNEDDFIFITELFGDNIKPGLMHGVRMQYHGNYEGLSKMIVQGINNSMIVPYLDNEEDREKLVVNPPFRVHAIGKSITDKDRLKFDNSLRYINHVLKLTIPETRRYDVYPETFSSTFYVI